MKTSLSPLGLVLFLVACLPGVAAAAAPSPELSAKIEARLQASRWMSADPQWWPP